MILLFVNIFLMATYISKENEARNDEMMLKEDITGILSGRGISVSPEMIPSDSIVLSSVIVKKESGVKLVAERLFGDVSETIDEKNTIYSSEKGNIMFSGDSFSLVFESEREIDSAESAERLAETIARKLSVPTARSEFETEKSSGNWVVRVPQMQSGLRVFDCFIEFKIFPNGSVMAHGKFIGKGSVQKLRRDMKRTSAILLDFADEMEKRNEDFVVIKKISLGYASVSRSAEITILMPAIEIETGGGVFCISMENGKIIQ